MANFDDQTKVRYAFIARVGYFRVLVSSLMQHPPLSKGEFEKNGIPADRLVNQFGRLRPIGATLAQIGEDASMSNETGQ